MLSSLPKHFRAIFLGLVAFGLPTGLLRAASTAMSATAAAQSAMADFQNKKYDAALRELEPSLQADPHNVEVLNLKGAILTKQKKYDAALDCYKEALQIAPGFFPAKYNVGALLALRHEWNPAIDYYRTLLIEQPSNELVEYKLLLLLLHENAAPELQAKLFATDLPTNTPAWYYATAARYYKNGNPSEAAKYLVAAKNIYGNKTEIFQEELDESGLNGTH
jgi:tetratricopeptide (TPR) repeat protein